MALLFSGDGLDGKGECPPLAEMNVPDFETALKKYCAWHVAQESSLPDHRALRVFDRYGMASELEAAWPPDPVGRGQTLNELYVGCCLLYQGAAHLALSTRYASEQVIAGASVNVVAPPALLGDLTRRLPSPSSEFKPRGVAAVHDGRTGHVVAFGAADGSSGEVWYTDPWPGESPFSGASGSPAGAARVPGHQRVWRLPWEAFDRFVIGVIWPPEDLRERLDGAEREPDALYEAAYRWASNFPGSRMAAGCAATALADVLTVRGLDDAAVGWLRQGAVHGMVMAAERLGRNLTDLEGSYWAEMAALMAVHRAPWAGPEEDFPSDEEVRYHSQIEEPKAAAQLNEGVALAQQGRFTEAKRVLAEARDRGNLSERTFAELTIGRIWMALDRPDLAVDPLYNACLSARIQIVGDACATLGDAFRASDRPAEALEAYQRGAFCGAVDSHAYCLFAAGELLRAHIDSDSAAPYFEAVVSDGTDEQLTELAGARLG